MTCQWEIIADKTERAQIIESTNKLLVKRYQFGVAPVISKTEREDPLRWRCRSGAIAGAGQSLERGKGWSGAIAGAVQSWGAIITNRCSRSEPGNQRLRSRVLARLFSVNKFVNGGPPVAN